MIAAKERISELFTGKVFGTKRRISLRMVFLWHSFKSEAQFIHIATC